MLKHDFYNFETICKNKYDCGFGCFHSGIYFLDLYNYHLANQSQGETGHVSVLVNVERALNSVNIWQVIFEINISYTKNKTR